jgi:hypothetical protein
MPASRTVDRGVAAAVGIYSLSRLVTLIAAWAAHFVQPGYSASFVLADKWDGSWFQTIIKHGYVTHIPPGFGDPAQTNIVFFPGFPLLARGVQLVTPLPPRWSAVVASLLASAVGVVFVFVLARRLTDTDVALRAVALLCFFPSAFILSMGYSEGLFIAAAAACLYCLHTRHWVLAGLVGAIGSATRPTGAVLVACCGWAALMELSARRPGWWRALVAPVLALVGIAGYFVYLRVHVGMWKAWFEAEHRGWGHRTDPGAALVRHIWRVVRHPNATSDFFNVLAFAIFVVGVVLLVRWRPPSTLTIYAVAIVLPGVLTPVILSTPRYVIVAFPIFIAFARVLRGHAFTAVVGASAAVMMLMMMIVSLSPSLVP